MDRWMEYKLFSYLMQGPRAKGKLEPLLPSLRDEGEGNGYLVRAREAVEELASGDMDQMATKFTECFVNAYPELKCPPYESWYKEGTVVGRARAEVYAAYRKYGLGSTREPPDHIAAELEFAAFLYAAGEAAEGDAFSSEHPMSWSHMLARDVIEHAGDRYVRLIGEALLEFSAAERRRLGLQP